MKEESQLEAFAHLLQGLPEPLQSDVYDFLSERHANLPSDDLPIMSTEASDRIRARLAQAIMEDNGPRTPESLPPMRPREREELAVHLFTHLPPDEQHMVMFYLMMKYQEAHPGVIMASVGSMDHAMLEPDIQSIHTVMENLAPSFASRRIGTLKLPDINLANASDRERVSKAEQKLLWFTALNHVTSHALCEHSAIMEEDARRNLSRVYSEALRLPAADAMTLKIRKAIVSQFEKAGLVSQYID